MSTPPPPVMSARAPDPPIDTSPAITTGPRIVADAPIDASPSGPRVEAGTEAPSPEGLLYPNTASAWRVKSVTDLALRGTTLKVIVFEEPGNAAGLIVARGGATTLTVIGGYLNNFGGNGVELEVSKWVAPDGTWATLLVRSIGHMHGNPPFGGDYTHWDAFAVRIDAMVNATPPELHLEQCEVRLVPRRASVSLDVRRQQPRSVERLDFDPQRHEFAR